MGSVVGFVLGSCQHGFVGGETRSVLISPENMQCCDFLWTVVCVVRFGLELWVLIMFPSSMLVVTVMGLRLSRLASRCWPVICQLTRLETRTKESIHMCEYVSSKLVCVMKVTVGT